MKLSSEATEVLFRPLGLSPNDRISIRLGDDKHRFICDVYQIALDTSANSALQEIEVAGHNAHAEVKDTLRVAWTMLKNGDRAGCSAKLSEIESTDQFIQSQILKVMTILSQEPKKTYASRGARVEFPSRIPERKQNTQFGFDCWEFAKTDFTVEIINGLWPREQIDFHDEETKLVFDLMLMTGKQQDEAAEVYAEWKANKVVPLEAENGLTVHPELPLSPYQRVAAWNALHSEGYALFMEQGTGKTATVIARIMNAARKLRDSGETRMYRCIIVAPKNVRANWEVELMKFATEQGNVHVIRGGPLERTKQFIEAFKQDTGDLYTVVVMSYEGVRRSEEIIDMIEWDLAILDESHYAKSNWAKRTKAVHRLRDKAAARMCLTGTAICNTVVDLYSQLEFLGRGWSGFTSRPNFQSFYGRTEIQGNGHEALVGAQNLPFLQERLARLSFMISKEEAMPDLPDKVYDVVEVEMSPLQMDLYTQLRDQLAVEVDEMIKSAQAEGRTVMVNNILTKLLRLAQVTSGHIVYDAVLDDDGTVLQEREVEHLPDNPKTAALVELMKEKPENTKCIIWCNFVADIVGCADALIAAFGKESTVTYYGATGEAAREENVRRFNEDPTCRFFIANPAAGGTGINLLGYPIGSDPDTAETWCDHVVYYSQGWSMPHRSQSEDRAHRRGTKTNVRITDLMCPGTIDEEIRARVTAKREHANDVMAVRSILDSILGKEVYSE